MKLSRGVEIVLVIPDTQLPFVHKDYLAFLLTVKRKYKPTKVVHIGDFFDLHALASYSKNPDGFSAGDEIHKALGMAQTFYKVFPEVYLCTSNHDVRIYKRAFDAGIPKAFLRTYKEWMQFPEDWTIQKKYIIDDVLYEHGEGVSGDNAEMKAAQQNLMSTVIGHTHTGGGVKYINTPEKCIFAMNVGCLIDDDAYTFEYNKSYRRRPVLGCGIVYKGVPQFIPMNLNQDKEWVGELWP